MWEEEEISVGAVGLFGRRVNRVKRNLSLLLTPISPPSPGPTATGLHGHPFPVIVILAHRKRLMHRGSIWGGKPANRDLERISTTRQSADSPSAQHSLIHPLNPSVAALPASDTLVLFGDPDLEHVVPWQALSLTMGGGRVVFSMAIGRYVLQKFTGIPLSISDSVRSTRPWFACNPPRGAGLGTPSTL